MSLEEIKVLSAYSLAGMADCQCPDDRESPGAKMLVRVRDNVVEGIENESITLDDFDDSGQLHEIADGAPSVYTHELWSQFVDLGAYFEDPDIEGEWPNDLNRAASIALYQIADRLAHAICERWRDEWQCPVCGSDTDAADECGNGCAYTDSGDDETDQDGGHPSDHVLEYERRGTFCQTCGTWLDQDTPAEAVTTGPVTLDPIIDLIADRERREAEEARISAETDSDIRRMDAIRIGHEIEVRAWRAMVATVTAILALVGIVTTVAVMS